ncbi:peptide-N-glycosidase F-related protein [Oceanihabitans sediminis]|nr:peptide-N-glycosidase F-related protein [Oceanihabitans sediminis]MDX1277865.1 peptide-N-glycosidase F-related protein [Oceanihabitans sediminis]MDX1774480.1 peptide-N-glycosidase F-related protein [Oceanihabitans sediminis]RBP27766.1 peptide-N-glycosidase F-like protein [Oceanihabitans sediminis]
MNYLNQKKYLQVVTGIFAFLLIINCSSDNDSGGGTQQTPKAVITVEGVVATFGGVYEGTTSDSQSVQVSATNLSANLVVKASNHFEVSLDDTNFSSEVSISKDDANGVSNAVYVRFAPPLSVIGSIPGSLTFESATATTRTIGFNGESLSTSPVINVNGSLEDFGDVVIGEESASQSIIINGDNLESGIQVSASEIFKVSLDDVTFSETVLIPAAAANDDVTLYVRFAPTVLGAANASLTISNMAAEDVVLNLEGNGAPVVHNYVTFDSERLAFGGGYDQSSTQTFNLHNDLSNIETIKMYVKLRCPTEGCDDWDVFANVKVLDTESGELYEIGRYITPYWNDNSQLERGFEFDVTDFKSLLTGPTELRIRTECWNSKGYEVTVDFDYIEGTPDYPYYAVSRVLAYDDWSSSGVPYGVAHTFDLDRTVSIPANAESTHLRTIISGWGHATPNDSDGRGCAEWCYRTHDIKINGANTFQHYLGPLGCASNPVSNQNPGNWMPDRAGWCPGMVVPVRTDQFATSMAGSTFNFEYDYEDWVSNGGNGDAYYATSTFVVVKSNSVISKPTVID